MKRITGVVVTTKMISLVLDGRPCSIHSDHINFEKITKKLTSGKTYKPSDIERLMQIAAEVEANLETVFGTSLTIDRKRDQIFWKETRLPPVLEKKLLQTLYENHSISGFSKFVDNLMQNPIESAIKELYLFLEKASLPITHDGHFLAYKVVRENFMDKHTGKIDNSVGKIVEMKREDCDIRREKECSYGLHFASHSYLHVMGSGKTIILKINPRDVVAIPKDYYNAKGRACRYEVVGLGGDHNMKELLEGKTEEEVMETIDETYVARTKSKFDWIQKDTKVMWGTKKVTVLEEPSKKSKGPWMTVIRDSSKRKHNIRCSELQEIE